MPTDQLQIKQAGAPAFYSSIFRTAALRAIPRWTAAWRIGSLCFLPSIFYSQ